MCRHIALCDVLVELSTLWYPKPGSNRRPPPCKGGALPAELFGHLTSAEHLIGTLSPCETSIVYLSAEFEPLTVAKLFTKQDGVVLITRDTISLIRNISWLRTEESNPQLVLLMQKKYRLLYRLNWCRIRDSNP